MKTSILSLAAIPAALFLSLPTAHADKLPSMAKPIKLTGIVAGSPSNGQFFLRANGETYRVKPLPEVDMKSIHGGDRVRVWGRPTGLRVNYANVRVTQKGASGNPTDYDTAPNTNIDNG